MTKHKKVGLIVIGNNTRLYTHPLSKILKQNIRTEYFKMHTLFFLPISENPYLSLKIAQAGLFCNSSLVPIFFAGYPSKISLSLKMLLCFPYLKYSNSLSTIVS